MIKIPIDLTVELRSADGTSTEFYQSEFVILWLFIAVLVILTAAAGYLLWKKVSLTF